MSEQISTIETGLYAVPSRDVPHVLHEFVSFEIMGTGCKVRTSPDGNMMFLRLGQRDFAVSLLDLAATAALNIEGHLKSELRSKILRDRNIAPAARPASVIPLRGTVGATGAVALFPRQSR